MKGKRYTTEDSTTFSRARDGFMELLAAIVKNAAMGDFIEDPDNDASERFQTPSRFLHCVA